MASEAKKAKRSAKEPGPVGEVRGQKPSSSKQQVQTVLAVFPDNKNGNSAYEALQMAVKDLKHTRLERLPFEKLDYGETASLDKFYAANVVVVDVTERNMQAALFFQLGLRESFDMKNNVVTMLERQLAFSEAGLSEANAPASAVSYVISLPKEQLCKHAVNMLSPSFPFTLISFFSHSPFSSLPPPFSLPPLCLPFPPPSLSLSLSLSLSPSFPLFLSLFSLSLPFSPSFPLSSSA